MRCPAHGRTVVYDEVFSAWRCRVCGHRYLNSDATQPARTRDLPARFWLLELAGRREAKRA